MRLALIVFCTALLTTVTFAADTPQQLSASDVQVLLDRIDKLEKRIADLEARQSGSTPPAATATAQNQPPQPAPAPTPESKEPKPPRTSEMEEMEGMHTVLGRGEEYPNLKIRGFGDVDFSANDHRGTTSGFQVGQFVLHFASALSPKISYFAEVSLSATPSVYNVDLERTIIRYDWNDLAKISFGRYHTPINYWNTAFHHGAWLQTTINRPDMIVFGGRFIPVHFIGAQSEGSVPAGALGAGYNLGIGNGRSSNIARAGDSGDANNNRAWLGNFYLRPPSLKHFQIGGSVYHDEITLPAAAILPDGQNFREWISSGHLIWTGETPEFFAEFANVHHRSILTGRTFDNQGGYVQIAYRFPFDAKKWKPYYRYDYLQVPANEPTLPDFTNVRKSTLGIRYDISDFAAFKAEYRNGRGNPLPQSSNAVAVQTAFTF
ncbi:MAG TPA: hypothetical protein VM912_02890 [Terriglobales bacterium]|nr:hypothetical protein [Terriglobales bacterium]